MSEDKGKKCSTCRTVKPLDKFDEERHYVKNVLNTNNDIEKTIEKNWDKRQRNIMNNTKNKNLRNRKKKLNVQFVRLTFQEIKCWDTKKQRHKNNLNNSNTKQKEQPVLSDKEKNRKNTKKP